MTDNEILEYLRAGGEPTFGLHGSNREVMALMADLEQQGLIRTEDCSLTQETRRKAVWIVEKDAVYVPSGTTTELV